MNVTLREGRTEDAQACGAIAFEAFKAVGEAHRFPPDFSSAEIATRLLEGLLSHPRFHAIIAEADGRIVGSNFVDERSMIAGIGPISVDPALQSSSIGRRLMQRALDRVAVRHFAGVRLVQAAYNTHSLSLYAKLGFDARDALSTLQGPPLEMHFPGFAVRPATEEDQAACNQLCLRVHGHDRGGEVLEAIHRGTARLVERRDRVTGYATSVGWSGHAVGDTNEDLKALIADAVKFHGPGFLVPTRNGELLRWCLAHGLRLVQQMTLMAIGFYEEPKGAWLPSVLY
jgi:predicted N-acetyltransferase YhbS